jgi:hypothetical protein
VDRVGRDKDCLQNFDWKAIGKTEKKSDAKSKMDPRVMGCENRRWKLPARNHAQYKDMGEAEKRAIIEPTIINSKHSIYKIIII